MSLTRPKVRRGYVNQMYPLSLCVNNSLLQEKGMLSEFVLIDDD